MLIILCCIYFKSASPDGFKQDKPFVAKLALAVPICQSILLHSKNKNTFISIITWQAGCWFWNQICLKESNLKKKKKAHNCQSYQRPRNYQFWSRRFQTFILPLVALRFAQNNSQSSVLHFLIFHTHSGGLQQAKLCGLE